MSGDLDRIRDYWDEDAAVYDNSSRHRPRSPAVVAAWTHTVESLLPPAPARVLDCGAGTGFLSLIAVRLGHTVTALDISSAMLDQLRRKAESEGLQLEVVVGPADSPPPGFDAVMERNLLWTLPDPVAALQAWRAASPDARLVSIGGLWGSRDPWQRLFSSTRVLAGRLRSQPPDHHAEYPSGLKAALPLGSGITPDRVVDVVERGGWTGPRLHRLWDVEWAERQALGPVERLLGVPPRFAVTAGPVAVSRPRPRPRRRRAADPTPD